MENAHVRDIVRLGRRIPVGDVLGRMATAIHDAVPDRTIEMRDTTTTASSATATGSCGANACEQGIGNSTYELPIILGIAIPVIGAFLTFFILHRRHVRKQREEDRNDRHASMDFGLGDVPVARARKVPTNMSEMSYGGEKSASGGLARRQLSMDLNMNSPYLLPPELQNSRESLHSLSRTIHQQEDPYRPVSQYYPGDVASIRSQNKQGSSIYTGSSGPSKLHDMASANLLANAGKMPSSHPPSAEFAHPPRQNSLPLSIISPVESIPPPYPVEPQQAHLPVLTPPSPESQSRGLPLSPRPGQTLTPPPKALEKPQEARVTSENPVDFRQSNDYLAAMIMDKETAPAPASPGPRRSPPPSINTLPTNPRPARKESMPQGHNQVNEENDYGDGFKVIPPSPGRGEQMRGQRYSMDVPPEQFAQAGLGAPGFDPKRLSMGFRPLPPNAVTESDDPEVRANRIRSFYKEYFDDSKPAPQGQYYEDYDENYLGEAAYFDPETNAFVMPYAEPVTRRAMTPPPGGPPRFPVPRGRQGSMGAMSAGGRGMRGPPPGPRAYSSASGRMGPPGPKRPLPPPTPLNSLPTPSKLKDDSFALTGSIEFAPPQTYRDRVAGRSESPFGERRPYSPMVPAFAPVVSAFDELAPMPSPHMLRKSGTFTSLDFAAPRKFRDPDTMSDAGSIRSNRSGISTTQLGAIRNGAYRISRIPKDVVFTKDDLATTLKPQWGMRSGV